MDRSGIRLLKAAAVACFAAAMTPALSWAQPQSQPPAAAPVVSPFDRDDPEIAKIRQLNWKSADFNALDTKSKCAALMALNRGLTNMGAKAHVREELLIDYLDAQDLGPTYATAKSAIPAPPQVTFDDLLKLATAYVKSPEGSAKVAGEFDGDSNEMLARYLALYERSARREMEETAESRWQVRSMGLFLQNQGKLDDFKTWSVAEQKRRDAELEQQRAEQTAQEQKERQDRAAAYAQQKQAQEDRAAQQMEAAMQQQQAAAAAGSSGSSDQPAGYVENDAWWGYGYPVGLYGYYNSNAYRGYVRDKAQDAYQRWQNRPQPRPMPARPVPARPARPGGLRR
jgi:hypothetical protein